MINLARYFPGVRDAEPCESGWNGTPVPILQRRWEMTQLLSLYEARRPQRVLEIGTFYGGTLYHWLQRAQPGAVVVSIDSYTQSVDNRDQYRGWCTPKVTIVALIGDSHSADMIATAERYGPFDWLVIDAGHYEHEVQADWDAYHRTVAPGGVIALHDILPAAVDWIQVAPVWERVRRAGYVTQEIVANPHADWGGWGVVFT